MSRVTGVVVCEPGAEQRGPVLTKREDRLCGPLGQQRAQPGLSGGEVVQLETCCLDTPLGVHCERGLGDLTIERRAVTSQPVVVNADGPLEGEGSDAVERIDLGEQGVTIIGGATEYGHERGTNTAGIVRRA